MSQNKRKQEIKKPCMIEQLKCMHAWVEPLTQVYSLSFNKLLPDEAGFVMALKNIDILCLATNNNCYLSNNIYIKKNCYFIPCLCFSSTSQLNKNVHDTH